MPEETTPKTIEEIVLAISQDKIVTPIIPVDITIGEAGQLINMEPKTSQSFWLKA